MKQSWLVLLVILAAILRLPSLTSFPQGFTPDEAAFGYNSYSLILTGHDEWATPFYQLPFTNLRSFGDYKLPLYAWLAVLPVKIFGLTEFAVRLPNALLGTLAVISVYLLARRLVSHQLGLLSAFLLAISPWHIQLSRGAFEANLVTFFLPLGLALLLSKKYLLAAVFLALNFYSYHSARYLTPFILLSCFLFYPRFLHRKFLLVLILLTLPGIWSIFGSGSQRAADVAIFRPTDSWSGVVNRRFEANQAGLPDFISRLFSNRPLALGEQFSQNYLSYLSPQFLFIQGAGESTYGLIPGKGVLYYLELPLLAAALIYLIRQPSRSKLFILSLLLLAPIAPALTKGAGYAANRVATMIPFIVLFNALGLSWLSEKIPKFKTMFLIGFVGLSLVSLAFFVENYFFHSANIFSRSMLAGRQQIIHLAKPFFPDYSEIRVSRSLSEPHIYVVFYLQIDPRQYQQAAKDWSAPAKNFSFLDQYDGYRLGKFRFGNLFPDTFQPRTLLIGQTAEFPPESVFLGQVTFPDGAPNLSISSTGI